MPDPPARRARSLVLLLAGLCAVSSSSVYLAQPLLAQLSRSFDTGAGRAGLVSTATQIGYALGIAALVPLGDTYRRRPLLAGLLAASAAATVAMLTVPSFDLVVGAAFAVGAFSPVSMLVVPYALTLFDQVPRGRLVGTLQAGQLFGLLAARAWAGALGELAGWRTVLALQVVLLIAAALLARAWLPASDRPRVASARSAWATLPSALAHDRRALGVCISGAIVGVAFGCFWTPLTFLLSCDYGYGASVVGLFGLVAAASALTSRRAGRLVDSYGGRLAQLTVLAIAIAGWVVLGLAGHALAWLICGTILLDAGIWSNQVVNQAVLYSRPSDLHNRLSTSYFTLRFIGISAGSLLGSLLWIADGWTAVTALGLATLLTALPLATLSSAR